MYIDTGAGNVRMSTYLVPVENLAVFTFDLTGLHKKNTNNLLE
ncbi:hypothetical protein THERMOS_1943 [Bathymodiolus thermophilus thioautotrophic gill symbiont]|uniref:Uncharacterized protein n=1 Tax=Bathymodiolus thermophilus thioautotrophic gill symbiont TaxID=2360 RepID=A0A8H8XE84_9GAMM|nr:hypothetical protein THERMOS_1943 [Bathymodiolus thermophilus thioautotrophic gill symbiont]